MTGGRRTLVTGISGQDGSILAEQLLAAGREVWGLVRGDGDLGAAGHLRDQVSLITGDLLEPDSLTAAVRALAPAELYHLAAPTYVPDSWMHPAHYATAIAGATATLLEAIAAHSPDTRLLVAASSDMFGEAPESPQNEDTPCRPRNPYATAKLAAHQLVGQLRRHAGLFACSAILYNHESERRAHRFVSRKITHAAAQIKLGLADELQLGDTSAIRDWSYAGDVMRGCRLILAQEHPRDYVLASGVAHTVQDFVDAAFAHVGLDPAEHVRIDAGLVRQPEHTLAVGDPRRARAELGWELEVSFEALVARMVDADLRALGARA